MSTTNVVSMATKETMLLKLCEEKEIERFNELYHGAIPDGPLKPVL